MYLNTNIYIYKVGHSHLFKYQYIYGCDQPCRYVIAVSFRKQINKCLILFRVLFLGGILLACRCAWLLYLLCLEHHVCGSVKGAFFFGGKPPCSHVRDC